MPKYTTSSKAGFGSQNAVGASRFSRVPWLVLIIYILLLGIGWLAIYTASYDANYPEIYNFSQPYGRQLIWIGVSLMLAFLLQLFDAKLYATSAYLIYIGILLLLLLTLAIGTEISGSKSWLRLGFFNLQPSELAKFATCLALAKYLSTINKFTKLMEYAVAALIIALPMLLILAQNDTGSALVYSSFILVLYREGLSAIFSILGFLLVAFFVLALIFPFYWVAAGFAIILLIFLMVKTQFNVKSIAIYLLPLLVFAGIFKMGWLTASQVIIALSVFAMVAALFFIWQKTIAWGLLTLVFFTSIYTSVVDFAFHNILQPHQRNRIGVILGIIEDKRGAGYNLNQSKIAIGSGGITGKGLLQGTQTKGNFIPAQSTDFIFCTIGEEFGFIGSLVLISLFLLLLIAIINIAERQTSKFSRAYAYGVAAIIFFHLFINIGMTIGLVPVIGIPLPFISYGGSSLFGFTILLFILVRLDTDHKLIIR